MVLLKNLDFDTVRLGQRLDVIDNEIIRVIPIHGVWTEAVVVNKDDSSVQVHYLCWDTTFDEIIPKEDFGRRVRAYGTRTFIDGGTIRRHNRVDVLDVHPSRNKWCTGFVVDARERDVLIHYKGYDKKFDEWINKYSNRLAPYGRQQFAFHADLVDVRAVSMHMPAHARTHAPRAGESPFPPRARVPAEHTRCWLGRRHPQT
jgi:hypothetical protein